MMLNGNPQNMTEPDFQKTDRNMQEITVFLDFTQDFIIRCLWFFGQKTAENTENDNVQWLNI